MPGLPEDLYQQLRTVLLESGSFRTDAQTRSLLVTPRLAPFRHRLPQAQNEHDRVNLVIDYLHEKYHSPSRVNALAELVRMLGVQFDENDALRLRLDALACELADRLKYPTRRGTDRGGEEAGTERQALPFLAVDRHFLESVRSVARVGVLRILDGRSQRTYTGTGWLVTSDLALTCAT